MTHTDMASIDMTYHHTHIIIGVGSLTICNLMTTHDDNLMVWDFMISLFLQTGLCIHRHGHQLVQATGDGEPAGERDGG